MTAPRKVLGWWFCAPDADGRVRLPHGDGREVGTDAGEPEDKILVRDFKWVLAELNRVAALAPRSERREGECERSFWRCRMGHEHSTHGAAMNCDRYGIVESAPPAAPKEEE